MKLTIALWIIIGTVLAGAAVIFILAVPAYAAQGFKLIPIAAVAGYALGIPVAAVLAKKIFALSK